MITTITQRILKIRRCKMCHQKHKLWEERVNMLSLTMGSNLSCYQLKINCYRYKLLYISFMVTTKQTPIVNTQKIERKFKDTTKKFIKPQRKIYLG